MNFVLIFDIIWKFPKFRGFGILILEILCSGIDLILNGWQNWRLAKKKQKILKKQ